MKDKIAVILIGNTNGNRQEYSYEGEILHAATVPQLTKAIEKSTQTDAEWVLFWNGTDRLPHRDLLISLMAQPVDVWHAGLKAGTATFPHIMNYVDPAWMYNKDADAEVPHTSFRLSFYCTLIRASVLDGLYNVIDGFTTLLMAGVALGYAILKSGGIIRYHPDLLSEANQLRSPASLFDEWIFARKFYRAKWHYWILMQDSSLQNINAFLKSSGTKPFPLKARLHPSDSPAKSAKHKTVSVLAPTLNRYEYLYRELEQLSQQTILPYEVLITDQTDIEDRQKIPFENFPNLTIRYFQQEQKGQCLAWNKLLEEAKGEYVLFLGDDADNITPDFIEKLLAAMEQFNADMVASNVVEIGAAEENSHPFFSVADTFPITLIKKALLLETGFMDMFFNKNIRADHDLAMRCHLQGALMIYHPSAVIHHHRAPKGGLRAHKARVTTNYISKRSITKFNVPASSEIYLVKKYYSPFQFRQYIKIKFFNQLILDGSFFKKAFKGVYVLGISPGIIKRYNKHLSEANLALSKQPVNF